MQRQVQRLPSTRAAVGEIEEARTEEVTDAFRNVTLQSQGPGHAGLFGGHLDGQRSRARKSLFREVVRFFKGVRNAFVEQKVLFPRRRGHSRSVWHRESVGCGAG